MLEPPLLYYWIIPLIIWSTVWKLVALWTSARNRQLIWLYALLLLILRAFFQFYIYYYQKDKSQIKMKYILDSGMGTELEAREINIPDWKKSIWTANVLFST